MAAPRCDNCATFSMYNITVPFQLHDTLLDLKNCTETVRCDICIMIWAAIHAECSKDDIAECLLGRPSDPEDRRDTSVILHNLSAHGAHLPRQTASEQSNDLVWVYIGAEPHVKTYTSLPVFAMPNTFAAKHMLGRYFTTTSEHGLCIDWAKEGLAWCHKRHPRCRGSGSDILPMPTRVIDLGEPSTGAQPKLYVTHGQAGCYMALSYSWGEGVRHKIQLKKATIETYQSGILEGSMTQTHQECLQIARLLGYRYVWIDAFGIIQDDKDDWAAESVKIADVYGNAHLTLVAGRGENSLVGFKDKVFSPALPPCKFPFSTYLNETEDGAACYIGQKRSARYDAVESRAWCFQELMLSRRLLIYGDQQMLFNCREALYREDGSYTTYRHGDREYFDLPVALTENQNISKGAVLERWRNIIHQYSRRDVYDPTDNFATMAGIALRFQEVLKCRFLAGLWEDDMLPGLLWTGYHKLNRSYKPLSRPLAVKGDRKGKVIARAPSWSWLALLGPIRGHVSRRVQRNLADESLIRCRPAATRPSSDGGKECWSPDSWDPTVVKYPFPQCRLEVLGCVRDVRCSTLVLQEHPALLQKMKKFNVSHAREGNVLLGPAQYRLGTNVTDRVVGDKRKPEDDIVAWGSFDLADENPSELSIMCLVGGDGLMLQRQPDGSFSRLGLFGALNEGWCFDDSLVERVVLV